MKSYKISAHATSESVQVFSSSPRQKDQSVAQFMNGLKGVVFYFEIGVEGRRRSGVGGATKRRRQKAVVQRGKERREGTNAAAFPSGW